MKKIYLLLFFVAVFAMNISAQVTIGSINAPTQGAVLELNSSNLGFLPTRVDLTSLTELTPIVGVKADLKGMVVYNNTATATIPLGLYLWDGEKWGLLEVVDGEKWFYMPSIVIETDEDGAKQKDLYALYKEQLNSASTNIMNGMGAVVPSAGAPGQVLANIPAATDLYYYVTDFDKEVFSNVSITADGKMSYTVTGPATDKTFMNIVFVLK